MTKLEDHRVALRDLPPADWESYLLAHSNLPGPRGNLELAQAAADVGAEAQFRRWAGLGPDVAAENTPECFLAFCGVVGLGVVLARRGRGEAFPGERAAAVSLTSDARSLVTEDLRRNASPLLAKMDAGWVARWRVGTLTC